MSVTDRGQHDPPMRPREGWAELDRATGELRGWTEDAPEGPMTPEAVDAAFRSLRAQRRVCRVRLLEVEP